MRLGPSLERYIPQIRDAVLDYAYCNYNDEPMLEQVEIDQWVGEIFNIKDIPTELHSDIVEDLKTLDLYDKIIKTCDKFVILPDVWSTARIPITGPLYPRNQYDTDRRNVVIINGKVFDLKNVKMKSIWYNHNRLLYCFYKDSLSDNIFVVPEGKKPTMSTIWLYEHGFVVNNIKGNEDKWNIPQGDEWFKFMIDENNRVTTNNNIDRVGIAINAHHIVFDYEKEVDPRVEVHIPGMESFSKDSWIRPKHYNIEAENMVYIHNKNVLFTNTFIVFYKDGSYNIENTYTKEKDEIITKIDKHTIKMDKDPNVSKVVVFVKPYDPSRYPAPDSLYYKATDKNMYAAERLKKYKKYTNDLYHYMLSTKGYSFEKLLQYGYKYDRDVLKVIQNFFKTVNELNLNEDVSVIEGKQYNFFKPKIIVRCWNKLQMYPLLFINHKLYMADYRIIKNDDNDDLVIDPEQMFKICGFNIPKDYNYKLYMKSRLDEYVPPTPIVDKYKNIEWIKEVLKKNVTDIKVCFVPYHYLDDVKLSRQSGRIFRNPVYRRELILDEVGDPTLYHSLFKGYQFVNGCLSNERFTGDLYRRLDGVNLFGYGPLDFAVTAKNNPTDQDVYNVIQPTELTGMVIDDTTVEKTVPTKIRLKFNDTADGEIHIDNMEIVPTEIELQDKAIIKLNLVDPSTTLMKESIYNHNNLSLLINRTTEPLYGACKVSMNCNMITHVCHYNFADTMYPIDASGNLKEYHTITFDKYGYECIDNVDILSGQYASCDNMYNYVAGNKLFDEIVVHFCPNVLKDIIRDYDLEIDETKINKAFNVGSYNDNALLDSNVKALFLPNEPSEVRAIPVATKSNKILLGQKILTRYWLGGRGIVSDANKYREEVAGLNGTFVNTNGTLGTVPNEFKDFIAADKLRGEYPLSKLLASQSLVYDMFVSAGITYINHNENYVDSNNVYPVQMDSVDDKFTQDNTLILNTNNDNFIKKEE